MILNVNGNKVPTKEYVDSEIKLIKDVLSEHIQNMDDYHTIDNINSADILAEKLTDDTEVELNISGTQGPIVNIDNSIITTDSEHRFITDAQLEIVNKSISNYELESAISDLSNDIKAIINKNYDNLINMKDSANALKLLNQLLSDDEKVKNLVELIASKVENDKFEEHVNSIYHMTKEDRDALDKVITFIKNGRTDWNAPESELNCILNKPDSYKANGGNADTVGGFGIDKVLTKSEYKCILGTYKNTVGYNENDVNTYISTDEDSNNIIQKCLVNNAYSQIKVREGNYNANTLIINNDFIIGSGDDNTFLDALKISITNSTLKDITINNATVIIGSKTRLYNVSFKNCDIIINNSNMSIIKHCIFDNECTLKYTGKVNYNNIITENIAHRTLRFEYTGGDNIITNNIYL